MNKKLRMALAGMALMFCIRGQSQSVAPQILNSAGGSYDAASSYNRFEWSFGEMTQIDTYVSSDGRNVLTQGVLQPATNIVTNSPQILVFASNEVTIFPNVTPGAFEVDFFVNLPGVMELQLTDALGRIIEKRKFDYQCCNRIVRFDISHHADGVYFINIRFTPEGPAARDSQRTRRESTYRVVKLKTK